MLSKSAWPVYLSTNHIRILLVQQHAHLRELFNRLKTHIYVPPPAALPVRNHSLQWKAL